MNLVYALSLLLNLHVLSAAGEDRLRGLTAEFHPIDGVTCNKDCINIESSAQCRNKCQMENPDVVECRGGQIPSECYDDGCCDDNEDEPPGDGPGDGTRTWKTVLGVRCFQSCMLGITECDNTYCDVVYPDSGDTQCIDGNLPAECVDCCLFDEDVDQPGYGATLNLDFDFPHSQVSLYADHIIDAIKVMIDAENRGAESDLKSAFIAAFETVAGEVEESLDEIEHDMNHAIADLKDSDEDIEGRLEDCNCVR